MSVKRGKMQEQVVNGVSELNKLKGELRLRGLSPMTTRNYSFFVEKFLKRIGKPANELNEDDAKLYLSELFDSSILLILQPINVRGDRIS